MKILIYQPRLSYYTGGGEVVPVQQAIYLSKLGHQVTVVTTRASFNKKSELLLLLERTDGVRLVYIDIPEKFKWIYDSVPGENWERWDQESLQIGLLARDRIQELKYDLGVVHLLLDRVALPEDRKNVVHLHGYPNEFQYHHKLFGGLSESYISVSDKISSVWHEILPPSSRSFVVKNGIDTQKFRPLSTLKTTDLLYVGRLLEVKGIDVLIRAISILDDYSINLTIAGVGPHLNPLKELVRDYNLADQISFWGYVDEDMLVERYNAAKIAVFPSVGKEGVLTTMLEACSCGLPVITTTAGSMNEFIINNETGILVKPNDSIELAKQIRMLLQDPKTIARIGGNARRLIVTDWSWENRIKELEEVYKEILYG